MSFIRPEVQTALIRWREALIGVGMIALGAYWAMGVGGFLGWIGIVVVAAGAGVGVVGIQRARFRSDGHGPGIVMIDEGQVTYMGPLTGGTVAMSDLDMLVLDPTGRPAHWVLTRASDVPLHIPVNADGAERLFDVFAGLPGIRTGHMLQEMRGKGRHPVVIWERAPGRNTPQRLH